MVYIKSKVSETENLRQIMLCLSVFCTLLYRKHDRTYAYVNQKDNNVMFGLTVIETVIRRSIILTSAGILNLINCKRVCVFTS